MGFAKKLGLWRLADGIVPPGLHVPNIYRNFSCECWIDLFDKAEPVIKEFYIIADPKRKSRNIPDLLNALISSCGELTWRGIMIYQFPDDTGDLITNLTKILDKKIIAVTESGDEKVVNVSFGIHAICKRCGNSGDLKMSVEDAIKSLQSCHDGCGKSRHYPWVPGYFK